jgi:hypothetical protein
MGGRRTKGETVMRAIVTTLILTVLVTATSSAQGARYGGYWGSLAIGGGARIVSSGGETETTGGGAMTVRMGGKLSDVLLLGGEIGGWGRQEDEVFVGRGNWTVTVVAFPAGHLGLFVKGGVGGATVRAVDYGGVGEPAGITKTGFGTTLGAGYDIPIATGASLTPGVDFMYQWVDDPDVRNGALVLLTLGVTWH